MRDIIYQKEYQKKYLKKFLLLGMTIGMLFSVTACSKLDVIGNDSVTAFDRLLAAVPDNLTNNGEGSFRIEAPDQSAAFLWSSDYSLTENDAWLEVDIAPFLAAGLDVTKLPEGMVKDDKLVVGNDFSDKALTYEGEITALASYEKLKDTKRELIGYHASLGHFGLDLSGGNMFEWAKDNTTNDKDMVFVLNPEVLEAAGVNLDAVDGWLHAEVKVMDAKGKMHGVYKLLKPFNLK
jgi:hypothetical protein